MIRAAVRPAVLAAALLPGISSARPQAPPPPNVRDAAIEKLASLLRGRYVFAEKGSRAADAVLARRNAGAYATERSDSDFALAVTRTLQGVLGDRHVVVQWRSVLPPPEDAARKSRALEDERRENFGFRTVARLEGNVGYVDIRSFDDPAAGGDTAVAAMNFISNCDALIFDLRNNGGGDAGMILLLASYLFEDRTHVNDREVRGESGVPRVDQYWTNAFVRGRKMPAIPVFVLTSRRTFSAAEEFAYDLQATKRATIIGETTGGGANPGDFFPLGGSFFVFIPTARSVNPITKSNWDRTGVSPDVSVPEATARDVAYSRALALLSTSATDPRQKAQLEWATTSVEGRLHPATLSAAEAARYAGKYGPRTVQSVGSTLSIRYLDRPSTPMVPLAGTTFGLEGEETFRLRFKIGPDGRAAGLIGLTEDGIAYESERSGD